jgi:hypothetical protein
MFMQNFNSLAITQTNIAKFWTFFQKNSELSKKFLSEFIKIGNLSMQF